MIKPHPNFISSNKPVEQQSITQTGRPPSEAELRVMCINNEEGTMTDLLQKKIDQWKLPFTIEFIEGVKQDGTPGKVCDLKNILTEGEKQLVKFITVHDETLQMLDDCRKMMLSSHEVLVTGESGTGKECIAKAMISNRIGLTKIVNCAGLPSELIESELFGHSAGAFTGAISKKIGLMVAAASGVMFLDEIGELPLSVQGKLLRALQEKTVRPIGSNEELSITCRFVCATNKDLRSMVKQGTFRRDLYARISTLELDILPLRDRMCDIVPITESLSGGSKFLQRYKSELEEGILDLSNNVRSIQSYVIRYNVLGRIK